MWLRLHTQREPYKGGFRLTCKPKNRRESINSGAITELMHGGKRYPIHGLLAYFILFFRKKNLSQFIQCCANKVGSNWGGVNYFWWSERLQKTLVSRFHYEWWPFFLLLLDVTYASANLFSIFCELPEIP